MSFEGRLLQVRDEPRLEPQLALRVGVLRGHRRALLEGAGGEPWVADRARGCAAEFRNGSLPPGSFEAKSPCDSLYIYKDRSDLASSQIQQILVPGIQDGSTWRYAQVDMGTKAQARACEGHVGAFIVVRGGMCLHPPLARAPTVPHPRIRAAPRRETPRTPSEGQRREGRGGSAWAPSLSSAATRLISLLRPRNSSSLAAASFEAAVARLHASAMKLGLRAKQALCAGVPRLNGCAARS